jgi:hypothetical protein
MCCTGSSSKRERQPHHGRERWTASRKASPAARRCPQFGKNERARHTGNRRTPSEAAQEIHCKRDCVPGLVRRRLLNGWITPTGLRISEESIARFKKKYISLLSIAREIGSSVGDLKEHCTAKQIPMVLVKNPYNEARQAFVRLRDRYAALSFRPVRVSNKPRRANRTRPNRVVTQVLRVGSEATPPASTRHIDRRKTSRKATYA